MRFFSLDVLSETNAHVCLCQYYCTATYSLVLDMLMNSSCRADDFWFSVLKLGNFINTIASQSKTYYKYNKTKQKGWKSNTDY